jgi:hypothetical protein
MSYVTNVILKTCLREERGIAQLNGILKSDGGFISCCDSSLPPGWYAGTRALECSIYPGAFNYLDLDELVSAIRMTEWNRPRWVQLFVQEPEEHRFREVELYLTSKTPAPSHPPGAARLPTQSD